jgi:hypothetical protein
MMNQQDENDTNERSQKCFHNLFALSTSFTFQSMIAFALLLLIASANAGEVFAGLCPNECTNVPCANTDFGSSGTCTIATMTRRINIESCLNESGVSRELNVTFQSMSVVASSGDQFVAMLFAEQGCQDNNSTKQQLLYDIEFSKLACGRLGDLTFNNGTATNNATFRSVAVFETSSTWDTDCNTVPPFATWKIIAIVVSAIAAIVIVAGCWSRRRRRSQSFSQI